MIMGLTYQTERAKEELSAWLAMSSSWCSRGLFALQADCQRKGEKRETHLASEYYSVYWASTLDRAHL